MDDDHRREATPVETATAVATELAGETGEPGEVIAGRGPPLRDVVRATVAAADAINVITAVKDRRENRASPISPCPDVQLGVGGRGECGGGWWGGG